MCVETLPNLNHCARHPARIAILVLLYRARSPVSFPEIRDTLGFTDGNLNRHLKVLVDAGWVGSTKTGAGRGSKTKLRLAQTGRHGLGEFQDWIHRVDRLLSEGTVSSGGQSDVDGELDGMVDDRSRGWAG